MKCPASRPRAFTLVELLVVIAILVILMAVLTPATTSLVRAMNMSRAVSMLADEMNYARQTALARNRDVELRLYKLDSKAPSGSMRYRAFRTLIVEGPNAVKPLRGIKHLPDGVIISEDTQYSTLFDYNNPARAGLSHGSETIPGHASAVEFVSFLFRPNGGTSLKPVNPPDGNWFLTGYVENAPVNSSTGIPDNYFTAQVDPVTGRVRTYRP